jgi:hypothetical protein
MTKPSPTITEREERLWHELAALTREQSRLVQEIVALTLTAADPRAIPAGALVEPDGQPLSTVPTVPTPANDDGGQP